MPLEAFKKDTSTAMGSKGADCASVSVNCNVPAWPDPAAAAREVLSVHELKLPGPGLPPSFSDVVARWMTLMAAEEGARR